MSIVKPAQPGNAFDVNSTLTVKQALGFKEEGYLTCLRYIPRTAELAPGNLTGVEMAGILNAGLSLGVVQHCPLPNWSPNAGLGQQYGAYGAAYCQQIGLPKGVTVWLDLEGVAEGTSSQAILDYCIQWYHWVRDGGYQPGIYCGWNTGLTNDELYGLPFENYWAAYNTDNKIPNRGYQMVQYTEKILNGIGFDPDVIQADLKGGLPFVVSNS